MSSSSGDSKEDVPYYSSNGWKDGIFFPTLLAGVVGGGACLVSKHRKVRGLANISATYATNLSIVTACYCEQNRSNNSIYTQYETLNLKFWT